MSFHVEIHGEYGDDDIDIVLKHGDEEIVMWTSDEWKEDPSLVAVIVNAVRIGYEQGSQAVKEPIEKGIYDLDNPDDVDQLIRDVNNPNFGQE